MKGEKTTSIYTFNAAITSSYQNYSRSIKENIKANPKDFCTFIKSKRGTDYFPLSLVLRVRFAIAL